MNIKNVALVILDGWGYAPAWGGNAITIAGTPNINKLLREFPNTLIKASGVDVGLPGHEVGNSEVGHMNIGAGQIIKQDISVINEEIKSGAFFANSALTTAIMAAKQQSRAVHLMGILSNGGIHSHIDHLFALLKLCSALKVKEVYIHAFTDGRDTDPLSGIEFINKTEDAIKSFGVGKIATILGRVYLDRKGLWTRTQIAYEALVEGKGEKQKSALKAMSEAYRLMETDEYIKPKIIDETKRISDSDTVIFFNFRSDRAKQLTDAFSEEKFDHFKRRKLNNLRFVSFVPFSTEQNLSQKIVSAFSDKPITNTLGQYYSGLGLEQFHIAETEKFAHVTYFINGNRQQPYPGEQRIIIPSPDVQSYDLKPEMSASQILEQLKRIIPRKRFPLIICNFANGDMVGHTGNFNAAVQACGFLDEIVKQLTALCLENQYELIITADHGNIEQMVDPTTNRPYTEHTNNPVPFIVVGENKKLPLRNGKLSDIASTVIELSGQIKPEYFDESLITHANS